MTSNTTAVRPSADEAWWLYEYQKAITNVRGLITHGQSEAATKLIDDLISGWQRGCQLKGSDNKQLPEPTITIGFKAAWGVWCWDTRFDALPPKTRATLRAGFVAGWRAREAVK